MGHLPNYDGVVNGTSNGQKFTFQRLPIPAVALQIQPSKDSSTLQLDNGNIQNKKLALNQPILILVSHQPMPAPALFVKRPQPKQHQFNPAWAARTKDSFIGKRSWEDLVCDSCLLSRNHIPIHMFSCQLASLIENIKESLLILILSMCMHFTIN